MLEFKYTLEELLEMGVYEEAGVDEDGEILYSCNFEKAKELAPEVYWHELEQIDIAILEAVDNGDLELDFTFDENGEPTVDYIVVDKD